MDKKLIDFINLNADAINNEEWLNIYGQLERNPFLAEIGELTKMLHSIGCKPELSFRAIPKRFLPRDYSGEYVVPDNIYRIDSYAFYQCTEVERIIIPDSVEEIGDCAFDCCKNLKEIRLPSNLTLINSGVFVDCDNLRTVELPESLQAIKASAFLDSGISDIYIPDSCTSIATHCFQGCISLAEISLPKNLERLHHEVFADIGDFRITYRGTEAEWHTIPKDSTWLKNSSCQVFCSDLTVIKY